MKSKPCLAIRRRALSTFFSSISLATTSCSACSRWENLLKREFTIMVVIMGVESRFVSSCASTSRRLPVYTTTTDGDGSRDSRSASIAAPADWPSMHLVVVDRGSKPSGRSFWRIVEGWIGREADVLIECCILFLAA